MEIWQIVPIIYGFIAAGIAVFISLRPRFYWLFLVCATVGAAGLILIPKSPYCVALVDELLVAAISAGAILALAIGAVKVIKKPQTSLGKIHYVLFFALAFYMLFQSIRGFYLWQEPLLLRWVIFYILIITTAFLTSNTDLPLPKKTTVVRAILYIWTAYLAVYLLHGFYIERTYGISSLSLNIQGTQWAGPNYAMLPLVVAIPAALFYLRQGLGLRHWLGWAALILTLVAGHFYDSRAAFAAVAIFLILSPTVIGLKRFLPLLLAGISLVLAFYWRTLSSFLIALLQSVTFSYSGDTGRFAIVRASIDAICQRVDTFLFGYGINSHHYVLAPFMKEAGHPTVGESPDYTQTVLPGQDFVYKSIGGLPDYVRVTGFGSILTDIGFIGALLFVSVVVVLALRLLIMARAEGRFVLLASLGLVMTWMLFSKVEDMVLIWFMLMPSGITLLLAGKNDGKTA